MFPQIRLFKLTWQFHAPQIRDVFSLHLCVSALLSLMPWVSQRCADKLCVACGVPAVCIMFGVAV